MKINFSAKNLFRLIYGFSFLAIALSLAYLYTFLNDIIYQAMTTETSVFQEDISSGLQKLETDKFERIIAEISKKKQEKNISSNPLFHQ
jgi:hypothetical protein